MFINEIVKINYSREGYLPDYPYHLISDAAMLDAFLQYEISITEASARMISIGDCKLLEHPKDYIRKAHLSSYEMYIDLESIKKVTLRGRKKNLQELASSYSLTDTITLSSSCYFSDNYPLMYTDLQSTYTQLVDAIVYHLDKYLDTYKSSDRYVIPDWVYSYMLGSVIGINSNFEDKSGLFALLNQDDTECEFTQDVFEEILEISKTWVNRLTPEKKKMRPPTIFGEPHVIKSLRLLGSAGVTSTEE